MKDQFWARAGAFCLALAACGDDTGSGQPCDGKTEGEPCGDGKVCVGGACVVSACEQDSECANDNPCDGAETCDEHVCVSGTMLPDSTTCATSTVSSGSCMGGVCMNATLFPERDFRCTDGATTPCETTEPVHTDEERTAVEPMTLSGSTLTFVIDALALPESAGGVAAGFNLDHLDSAGGSTEPDANCGELNPDFLSLLDPDHIGVDSALGTMVPALDSLMDPGSCPDRVARGCVDATLAENIASGQELMLIEVGGVDDLLSDANVTVQVFRGSVPGGGTPVLNGAGTLAPGQTFDAVALGAPLMGDIFGGRVRALVAEFTFSLPIADQPVPLDMVTPELRFDITETELEDGQIGGVVGLGDLIAASPRDLQALLQGILEPAADISPSPADPSICTNISVGATFRAVAAVRNR